MRLIIVLSEPLKEELDAYAAALIPYMLEAFIRTDRGWRSRRKRSELARSGQRRVTPARNTTRADSESSK